MNLVTEKTISDYTISLYAERPNDWSSTAYITITCGEEKLDLLDFYTLDEAQDQLEPLTRLVGKILQRERNLPLLQESCLNK